MKKLIQLVGITKTFTNGKEDNRVLKGIYLEIFAGDKISIVGQSGEGKSTLLNILGLVMNPSSGDVFIDSINTKNIGEPEKAKLRNSFFGYITQDFSLIEEDTVFENIEIPLLYNKNIKTKKERRKRIIEVLKKVSLSEKIYEKAKKLSGGQRQRVAIARALVNEPQILLCDEPTGSLDNQTGEEIFSLLETLTERGKVLIMVTHNENLANRCSKKIILQDGKLN